MQMAFCVMAPTAIAPKKLLDLCFEYSIAIDLIYSPLKYVCMVFKPRRFKDKGVQFFYFFYKIYSLCKNNAISKILNKLQAFHFRSTVHTNTTPTVIKHSYVIQKPPFCHDNGD